MGKHKKTRVYKNLDAYRKQRSEKQKLLWENPEYRKKLVDAHTGKPEELHPNWKGEKASYISKHKWVIKHLGKPQYCEMCGRKDERRALAERHLR